MGPFFVAFLVVAQTAPAEVVPDLKDHIDEPPHTWVAMRGGLSNDPTVLHACAEVTPLEGTLTVGGRRWHTGLGVEACGNGSGFLFQSPAPEIAHFRARLKTWAFDTQWGWFEPFASFGFAELQTGADVPGFSFFGTGPGGTATAGPEAGASLRYKLPLPLGFELLVEGGISVAYFAYARALRTPADPFQTSLMITAGLGF